MPENVSRTGTNVSPSHWLAVTSALQTAMYGSGAWAHDSGVEAKAWVVSVAPRAAP